MLRIVLCDDEKSLRKLLRQVIEPNLAMEGIPCEITEARSGEQLLSLMKTQSFDIFFLDIKLPAINGVETARLVRKKDPGAVIIFVTAYADFVFSGYEVQALDYILKPCQPKEILSVLHRAIEQLQRSADQYYIVEQKSRILRVLLREVAFFYSERRTVTAVCPQKSPISFYEKLNDVELKLPGFFIRIHNRYLININHVTALEGNQVVCGGQKLPVSRACKQDLSIAFAKYLLRQVPIS